jgi:hypothetical protein
MQVWSGLFVSIGGGAGLIGHLAREVILKLQIAFFGQALI